MTAENIKLKAFKAAFPHTIPVLAGFSFLGIAYGILMRVNGYPAYLSLLMSLFSFCGSMQFLAVSLLAAGFDPIQTFLLSLMVNARHLFYGISMLKKYRGIGKIKFFLIFLMCDETFSIVCSTKAPKDVDSTWFYFFVSLLDYSYWVIASFVGGVLGEFITFDVKGLDFVLTALFVVIFVDRWKSGKSRKASMIGIASTIVCLVVFGKDNFIIPSMILILIILSVFSKKLVKERA